MSGNLSNNRGAKGGGDRYIFDVQPPGRGVGRWMSGWTTVATRCSMIFKVDAPTIRNRVPHFDGDKIDGMVGGFRSDRREEDREP